MDFNLTLKVSKCCLIPMWTAAYYVSTGPTQFSIYSPVAERLGVRA